MPALQKERRKAHVLEPTKAGEQTNVSDVRQNQRRGSAVMEEKAREYSAKSERCSVCPLAKIRGAKALLLEPAKTVEQTNVLDVPQILKARKRYSLFEQAKEFPKISDRKILFQNVVSSIAVSTSIFVGSVTGKPCSKCCSCDGCKQTDFYKLSRRKILSQMFLFFAIIAKACFYLCFKANDELTRQPFPLVGDFGEFKSSIKEVKRKGCRVE